MTCRTQSIVVNPNSKHSDLPRRRGHIVSLDKNGSWHFKNIFRSNYSLIEKVQNEPWSIYLPCREVTILELSKFHEICHKNPHVFLMRIFTDSLSNFKSSKKRSTRAHFEGFQLKHKLKEKCWKNFIKHFLYRLCKVVTSLRPIRKLVNWIDNNGLCSAGNLQRKICPNFFSPKYTFIG